ncbi:MAG TPA: hypothetical protein VN894_06480 [Polyangiaceae bacterium]|nr:hypothetical protein [Polyangiaceae bacterium]
MLPGLLAATPYGRPAFTPCVVQVYAAAGRADRALRELDDALAFVEASDERALSSELHRMRGELLADVDRAAARQAFESALEISRQQGARSFELRAALSLAKLDHAPLRVCFFTERQVGLNSAAAVLKQAVLMEPKRSASLKELRGVYSSFSEGFGTADLVEAKALLDAGK